MTLLQQYSNLTAVGLVYDIAGVVLIARAVFLNTLAGISAQSKTSWSQNYALRRALVEQRVDALFGLPLLVIGFVLQLAGISRKSEVLATSAGLLLLLAIVVASCWWGRDMIVRRMVEAITKREEKLKQDIAQRAGAG